MNHISEDDLNHILDNTKNIFNENFIIGSNIFISGATGFFGKWLMESFLFINKKLNLNANIFALSRNPEIFIEKFPFYNNEKCLTWVKGDIRTFKFPSEKFTYIIHAATDTDANLHEENPLLMLDTLIEGTKRILEFAKMQSGIKAFLFTSSGAIYGKQPENITHIKELDCFNISLTDPSSAYSEGKRISELYCSVYNRNYNIPIKIVRCFSFVGPYLPLEKHFAIGNFIYNGLNHQNITIHGDGLPFRSYMYASDLAIWLWTILLEGKIGEVYNVGSDQPISIKELAQRVAGYFPGITIELQNQIRKTDRNQNYIPDTSKAFSQFNFSKGISLNDSILKTIQFMKNND